MGFILPGLDCTIFLAVGRVLLSQLSGVADQDGAKEFAKSWVSSVSQLDKSLSIRRNQILSAHEDVYESVYREIVRKRAATHK